MTTSKRNNRIAKIKALAEKGIDGEQANAIAMLKRLMEKDVITVDSYKRMSDGIKKETNHFKRNNTIHDIPLLYMEFVFNDKDNPTDQECAIWRQVGAMAHDIIREITGKMTVQNWTDKITCNCTSFDVPDITKIVSNAIYNLLWELKIPVIHHGGDKGGFGCNNDCMEDGTENSIYQYQVCSEYEAPNREAEIFAAMALPRYNKFVAITMDAAVWGKITGYDKENGTITVTPLNTSYPAVTMQLADITHLYRLEAHSWWYNVVDPEGLQAAKERKARNETVS